MSLLLTVWAAPKDNDVVAGWGAFWLFVGLGLAVAFLGWSLVRQLRKAQRAKDAGVYGDEPVAPPAPPAQPEDADQGR